MKDKSDRFIKLIVIGGVVGVIGLALAIIGATGLGTTYHYVLLAGVIASAGGVLFAGICSVLGVLDVLKELTPRSAPYAVVNVAANTYRECDSYQEAADIMKIDIKDLFPGKQANGYEFHIKLPKEDFKNQLRRFWGC